MSYIFFLVFVLLLLGVFAWGWRLGFRRISNLDGFTEEQRTALRRQMLALWGVPVFLLIVCLFALVGDISTKSAFLILLAVGLAPLIYISFRSILDRVCLQRGFLDKTPPTGAKAVRIGVANLVVILIAAGFVVYLVVTE